MFLGLKTDALFELSFCKQIPADNLWDMIHIEVMLDHPLRFSILLQMEGKKTIKASSMHTMIPEKSQLHGTCKEKKGNSMVNDVNVTS